MATTVPPTPLPVDRYKMAILMLHDQAHGGPYLTCREEPCLNLPLGPAGVGPGPLTLPISHISAW